MTTTPADLATQAGRIAELENLRGDDRTDPVIRRIVAVLLAELRERFEGDDALVNDPH